MPIHRRVTTRSLAGTGADVLDGGAGTDRASYLGSRAGVAIDLSVGTGADSVTGAQTDANGATIASDAAGDVLSGVEDVTGSIYADVLVGDGAVNVLSGEAGDDTLVGGSGADSLSGGDGRDVATYDGNSGSFDVVYDRTNDQWMVTDTAPAAFGDEGSDTLEGIESIRFDGDGVTLDLTTAPVAWTAMAGLPSGGTASWKLFATGGTPGADGNTDLTFSVETANAAVSSGVAGGLGFDNALGAVYATADGHVQVTAAGSYTYMANSGYTGEDTFSFRVTDNATGLASVAAISVYSGTAMPAITEDDVISYDVYAGGTSDDTFSGGSGQDFMSGGAGDDVLDGGSGQDVAQYAGASTDFDVVYNVEENSFTVTDLAPTTDGDEGTDVVRQVGRIDLLADGGTIELTDLVKARESSLQVEIDGSATWNVTVEGGRLDETTEALDFDYSIETQAKSGTVTINASTGEYTYTPNTGYEGTDSFDFRVADTVSGIASVATVSVGVGDVGYEVANSLSLNGTDEYLSWKPGSSHESRSPRPPPCSSPHRHT